MCDKGKRAMLGKRGGVIWDIATGQLTNVSREKDGVYGLNLWFKYGVKESGVTRPGM